MHLYTQQSWIEEVTGGHLSAIEDQELWEAIANFLDENGLRTVIGGKSERKEQR